MPGFVKTSEEVRIIENFLSPSRFIVEDLTVQFQTTWDFARSVLPPIFEPIGNQAAGTASAFAEIGQFQSAYCGPMDCAMVGLHVTYEGEPGFYILTEIISGEGAVVLGREIWGEIKKHGTTRLYADGTHRYGVVERRGYTLWEIEAEITGEEEAPMSAQTHAYDIKMFPGSNGRGLEYPPRLNIWDAQYEYSSYRVGTASLKWGASPWDPVSTIPIVSMGEATLVNATACFPLKRQAEIADPDGQYVRYMWGRGFDDPTLSTIPQRWKNSDQLNGARPLIG